MEYLTSSTSFLFSLLTLCIESAWEGFGSRGITGVASVRRCQKLPLCPIKPMPAGSKMDLQKTAAKQKLVERSENT